MDYEITFTSLVGTVLSFGVLGKLCNGVGYECACPQLTRFACAFPACRHQPVSEKSSAAAKVSGRAFVVRPCLASLVLWLFRCVPVSLPCRALQRRGSTWGCILGSLHGVKLLVTKSMS